MKRNTITSLKKFNAGLKLAHRAFIMGEVDACLHLVELLQTLRIARTGGRSAVSVGNCDVLAIVTCGYTLVVKSAE